MASSTTVMSAGSLCFGLVAGYITYRTLARSNQSAQVSDIASVLGAIGGGAITALFPEKNSDSFGWYSIGLLIGMAIYLALSLLLSGRQVTATTVLGDAQDALPRQASQRSSR